MKLKRRSLINIFLESSSRPGRTEHCEIKDLSVPRMLQTPGDASVGEKRGSIKQGRRHATKRFTARPRSGRVTSTHTHTHNSPVAINTDLIGSSFLLMRPLVHAMKPAIITNMRLNLRANPDCCLLQV